MMNSEDYSGTVTMILTNVMADEMEKAFGIEMLFGHSEKQPDGRIKFVFEIGSEKGELVHNWMLRMISKSDQINYN